MEAILSSNLQFMVMKFAAFAAAGLAVSLLSAPEADAQVINVGGSDYEIETLVTSYLGSTSAIEATPWWGNQSLATAFSQAFIDQVSGLSGGSFAFDTFIDGSGSYVRTQEQGIFTSFTDLVPQTRLQSYSFVKQTPPPPPSTSSVPGPLPIMGALAGFGLSRKLRNRIKISRD